MTIDLMGWYILPVYAPVMLFYMRSVKACPQSIPANRQLIGDQLTIYGYDQRFC